MTVSRPSPNVALPTEKGFVLIAPFIVRAKKVS
jgi:hypothetical protein